MGFDEDYRKSQDYIKYWTRERNWGIETERDFLITILLKEALLSDILVAKVLYILDHVCPDCFDNDKPCYCTQDD